MFWKRWRGKKSKDNNYRNQTNINGNNNSAISQENLNQSNKNGDNFNNTNIGGNFTKNNFNKSISVDENKGIITQINEAQNVNIYQNQGKLDTKLGDKFERLDRKFIVGRDREIDEIKKLLNEYKGVNIWGVAGIGKTTLAKAVFNELDKVFNYEIVFVLTDISKNIVSTLKEKIVKEVELLLEKNGKNNYLKSIPDLDEKYKEALNILDSEGWFSGNKLIIIDNIISFKQGDRGQVDIDALEKLFALDNTQFILTSRQKLEDFPYIANYHLKPLEAEDSLKLFRKYYKYKPDEESKVIELIEKVQRNTYFIKLLAKTLAKGKKINKLLASLKNPNLVNQEVLLNGNIEELRNIYNELLNISWDMLTDLHQKTLKKIALLPANVPLDIEFMERYLQNEFARGLVRELVERGFLEWGEEDKNVLMHQITKDYVLHMKGIEYKEIDKQIEFILNEIIGKLDDYKALEIWKTDKIIFLKELEIYWKISKVESENIGNLLNKLGVIYKALGKFKIAEIYYIKALKIREKILSPNHPDLAVSYNNLATLYRIAGDYNKAKNYYTKALKIFENVLPKNHIYIAHVYNNLALLYKEEREYNKAEEYLKKALKIFKKELPIYNPYLVAIYKNLANLYKNIGNYKKAEKYFRKVLKIRENILPLNSYELAFTYLDLANLYLDKKEYNKAEIYYKKTLEIFEKVLPSYHPDLAISYNNLGLLYKTKEELDKAEKYYKKALEIFKKILPSNHLHLAISYNNLGLLYKSKEEYDKAEDYYKKALNIFKKRFLKEHTDLAFIYNNLANLYYVKKSYYEAEEYFLKALEIFEKILPPNHPSLKITYKNLAYLYKEIGREEEAERYFMLAGED